MAKKKELPKKKPEWVPDPTQPGQLMRQLPGVTEHKLTPEESLKQISLARARRNVPLPPETLAEQKVKEAEIQKLAEAQEAQKQPVQTMGQAEITRLQPSDTEIPTIEQMQEEIISPKQARTLEASKKIISDVKAQEGIIQGILPRSARITLRTAGMAVQQAVSLQTLIELWDITKKMFTQKKPLKYQNALEGFNARVETIRMNVADAKAGQPYYDAEDDLRQAVNDFSRLKEAATGFGKANPNWLIDEGFSIQAEIDNKLEELNDLRTDLEYIKRSQRLAQAAASYGT